MRIHYTKKGLLSGVGKPFQRRHQRSSTASKSTSYILKFLVKLKIIRYSESVNPVSLTNFKLYSLYLVLNKNNPMTHDHGIS
jgi:hypothetical protein